MSRAVGEDLAGCPEPADHPSARGGARSPPQRRLQMGQSLFSVDSGGGSCGEAER